MTHQPSDTSLSIWDKSHSKPPVDREESKGVKKKGNYIRNEKWRSTLISLGRGEMHAQSLNLSHPVWLWLLSS